jgi:hypothetical protein
VGAHPSVLIDQICNQQMCNHNYAICSAPAMPAVQHSWHTCGKFLLRSITHPPNSYTVSSLYVGQGELVACVRVAALPPGEVATTLQWSQATGLLVAGTNRGRLLQYTCGTAAISKHTGNSVSGREEDSGDGVWGQCDRCNERKASGILLQQPAWAPNALPAHADGWLAAGCRTICLDGPIRVLCLEPSGLCEGVAATASGTAWYVQLDNAATGAATSPLVAGPSATITNLECVPANDMDVRGATRACDDGCCNLAATLTCNGRVALWSAECKVMAPLAEVDCGIDACALAVAPGAAAAFLGSTDGSIARLDLVAAAAAAASAAPGTFVEEEGAPAMPPIVWNTMRNSCTGVGDQGNAAGAAATTSLVWREHRHASQVVRVILHPLLELALSVSRCRITEACLHHCQKCSHAVTWCTHMYAYDAVPSSTHQRYAHPHTHCFLPWSSQGWRSSCQLCKQWASCCATAGAWGRADPAA